ncbi:serine hydroxymethyltransferase [Nitriliruptoraceae bacterium ZYF776]|nr:serine hydroxymethyltransferase [Profundirhabdus halotolerans]
MTTFWGPDLDALRATDPAVADKLLVELDRQRSKLQLIASENFASPAVMAAQASVLTNKYAEGYPGKRYYGGCEEAVDPLEQLAIDRAKQLFGADHANVQPHSGASANIAAYFATVAPGEKVLAMSLPHGGHLTHGMKLNFSGRWFDVVSYGVRQDTEVIDMDEVRDLAREHRPKLIIAGWSAYPRQLDFEAFRAIADEVGAVLMCDAAHFIGLVAAGAHPSPVPYCDIVTFTTHKTLRGPRGAIILTNEQWAKPIDKAVFPGTQGGPLEHVVAAKAVALKEAMDPAFKEYGQRILDDARALADGLTERGYRITSGGTDTHLFLADVTGKGLTGAEAEARADAAGIVLNKNAIPFDQNPPAVASGIRAGAACVATQGMGPDELRTVAGLIDRAITGTEDDRAQVRDEVHELVSAFPAYPEAGEVPRDVDARATTA